MNSSENTVYNGLGSGIKVQAISGDFLPQSEIVLVLIYLIILLCLLHLVRELWIFRSTCFKYLTDFLSNMKCIQNIEYFGRTESNQTLEKKNNVDTGTIQNTMAIEDETNDVEKGTGDIRQWHNGFDMEGGQCEYRRNSILR